MVLAVTRQRKPSDCKCNFLIIDSRVNITCRFCGFSNDYTHCQPKPNKFNPMENRMSTMRAAKNNKQNEVLSNHNPKRSLICVCKPTVIILSLRISLATTPIKWNELCVSTILFKMPFDIQCIAPIHSSLMCISVEMQP